MKESRLTSVGASEGSGSSIIVSKKRERLIKPELRPNQFSAIYNRRVISGGEQGDSLDVPRMMQLKSTHMVGESNSANKIFKSKVGAISDASGSIGMGPKPSLLHRDALKRASEPNQSKISGSGESKTEKMNEEASNQSNSSGSELPGLVGLKKMSGEIGENSRIF